MWSGWEWKGEVSEGRACQLDTDDIRRGIQLLPPQEKKHKLEPRASREQAGCLTAHESLLNADYRPRGDEFDQAFDEGRAVPLPSIEIPLLAVKYEHHFDRHVERQQRKGERFSGTPRMCDVIAARVKTILSNPALSEVRQMAVRVG
jgi:hypothetical protein